MNVFVVGGGAAGMMAAIGAATNGHTVTLFEKNEKLGKKLFITGKGRCNITNASDINTHMDNVMKNSKFLYSAYNALDSYGVVEMIESAGIPTKVERGNRVFPKSDHSSDVIKALKNMLEDLNVKVVLDCEIKTVDYENSQVILTDASGNEHSCDRCIIATGGISYRSTGSTGDGYKFARELEHDVSDTYPSLVPMEINDDCCNQLQGLSLKNVSLAILDENNKQLYFDQGEMLFTHFGISGPLVLIASSYIADKMEGHRYKAVIDLKPALSEEKLDARILRDFDEFKNKNFNNSLSKLLPNKLIPIIIEKSGINPYKKVNEVTKTEREHLVKCLKHFELEIVNLRGFDEAIITKGGIDVSNINPKTMQSKLHPNISFAGEVLDLDALTGGFNLQIAWSTGYLAGINI